MLRARRGTSTGLLSVGRLDAEEALKLRHVELEDVRLGHVAADHFGALHLLSTPSRRSGGSGRSGEA